MACYRPLPAQYRDDGSVAVRPFSAARPAGPAEFEVPCGSCIGCKVDRARAWSIRIGHEASGWDRNAFVTLDYAPEHLHSWSLQYRDFQLFMKRLRKVSPAPVRFFVAGEYGELYRRPHWHAILFNWWPTDAQELRNGTFRSTMAENVWKAGQVVIGRVTPASAGYVAGYTYQKRYGKEAEEHYEDLVNPLTGEVSSRRREFVAMSRRPGIGAGWYEKYWSDLFPNDIAVQDGREYKVPRYYWNRFRAENPDQGEEIAERRYLKAMEKPEESTPERRAVREQVALAKQKFYSRRS